jgi:hypothetical protein
VRSGLCYLACRAAVGMRMWHAAEEQHCNAMPRCGISTKWVCHQLAWLHRRGSQCAAAPRDLNCSLNTLNKLRVSHACHGPHKLRFNHKAKMPAPAACVSNGHVLDWALAEWRYPMWGLLDMHCRPWHLWRRWGLSWSCETTYSQTRSP